MRETPQKVKMRPYFTPGEKMFNSGGQSAGNLVLLFLFKKAESGERSKGSSETTRETPFWPHWHAQALKDDDLVQS